MALGQFSNVALGSRWFFMFVFDYTIREMSAVYWPHKHLISCLYKISYLVIFQQTLEENKLAIKSSNNKRWVNTEAPRR